MSDYLNQTEEQQFQEAKKWLKQNGLPILAAILVGLAAAGGWNFWKNQQIANAKQTSSAYQNVMESYLQNPEQNAPLVEKFVADNNSTNYAVFAQLEQAKQQVAKSDFAGAKRVLSQALANSSDATLQNIIRFRLAAVELQLQQYDDALATLAKVSDKAWELRKQVFAGDILAAKGDVQAAKSAYEQAKANAPESEQMLIDIRLNNL